MGTWNVDEENLIADIMVTETMHDPDCRGCMSCDDINTDPSCHVLCSRSEAIRRMRRRLKDGVYVVRNADAKIYKRELKRWPKSFLTALRASLDPAQAA
jgi:hypothetical protein